MQDGAFVGSETVAKCVTAELAHVVLLVWEKAKVGGSEDVTLIALRTTMTYTRRWHLEGGVFVRRPHNRT